ncbi:hypothetical protein [Streptomyces niphimycinicus]|uniref:hypothetical protein n=1 Tax=Streptomyces niphimycinicus TaxID=2842201 RepID=UPI003FD7A592
MTAPTVGRPLKEHRFSLRGTAKTSEGDQHPDRAAQFRWMLCDVLAGQVSPDVKGHSALGTRPPPPFVLAEDVLAATCRRPRA